MDKSEMLGKLPAVDQTLRSAELADLRRTHPHELLVEWIREATQRIRHELVTGTEMRADELLSAIVRLVVDQQRADFQRTLQPVINATGIILHTNLGRAPLAAAAIERMVGAAAYTNLELELDSGKRSPRAGRVMQLLARVTGAEDALVVNNCAGATVLVLQAIAAGMEVIISRGQLVEIGGGFRLPDVFRAAGVILRDVGTTNRTYLSDYAQAMDVSTGAIIRVHRSNFAQIGFVAEPSIQELLELQRPTRFPVIDDLGSGCLYDLSEFGLDEPCVKASVQAGADLSLFSGDKLFGGPQCGIIVGKKMWIERLRVSPMLRALRSDKVTLAALEATVEIHLAGRAFEQLPVLRMLSRDVQDIRENCRQLVEQLSPAARASVSIESCQSQLGGGTLPGQVLPSFGLAICGPHLDRLSRALRLGTPAIQGRLTEDRLWLDLRTVDSTQIDLLAQRLNDLLANPSLASAAGAMEGEGARLTSGRLASPEDTPGSDV